MGKTKKVNNVKKERPSLQDPFAFGIPSKLLLFSRSCPSLTNGQHPLFPQSPTQVSRAQRETRLASELQIDLFSMGGLHEKYLLPMLLLSLPGLIPKPLLSQLRIIHRTLHLHIRNRSSFHTVVNVYVEGTVGYTAAPISLQLSLVVSSQLPELPNSLILYEQ